MAAKIWVVIGAAMFAVVLGNQAIAATTDKVTEKVIESADLSASVYSPSDGKPHPAILVLGGAEGGRDWADAVAKRFAQDGYIALAESYFKGHGLPDQLENIPLERFQAAIDYLEAQPSVDKRHIAAVGLSKGAEAVLVLAARDPRLKAVVAASPSDVVWQGIDRKGGSPMSSWTLHHDPLAYVPFKPCPECKGLLDLYSHSRNAGPVDPPAMIAVEHINGPILLISSTGDQVWPSTAMARSIVGQLHQSGFRFKVSEVDYPEGGHFAFGIQPTEASAKEDTGFGGGTPDGLAKARTDSWQCVLSFLAHSFAIN